MGKDWLRLKIEEKYYENITGELFTFCYVASEASILPMRYRGLEAVLLLGIFLREDKCSTYSTAHRVKLLTARVQGMLWVFIPANFNNYNQAGSTGKVGATIA